MYGGNVIGFNEASSWNYGNDFARNVIIFSVSNSSSSHTDNRKDDFLVLVEGSTDDINGSVGIANKRFSIDFDEAKTDKISCKFAF